MPDSYWTHDLDKGFEIFGIDVRWYGVLYATTFLLGYLLGRRTLMKFGYPEEKAQIFYFFALIGGIAGARAGHVLIYDWEGFLERPGVIFEIWNGGMASHGGVAGLVVACLLFSWVARVRILHLLDMISLPLCVAAILIRVGNFINGEVVGRVTDVSWAMIFPDYGLQPRHPTPLYEAGYAVLVFGVAWAIDAWRWKKKEAGGSDYASILFWTGGIHYMTWRFAVEFFKEYQTIGADFPLTMGQLLSLPLIAIGIGGTVWILRRAAPPMPPPGKTGASDTSAQTSQKKKVEAAPKKPEPISNEADDKPSPSQTDSSGHETTGSTSKPRKKKKKKKKKRRK